MAMSCCELLNENLIVKPTAVVLYVNRMVYTNQFTMGASIIYAPRVVGGGLFVIKIR